MEYTTENLEYAVSVFYNGEHAPDRVQAHAWLTAAQRVPEAWTFLWDLLQPSKRTEVQFYAATTLHTKILRCWNEVPPESYQQLKEKILNAVTSYSKGPKIVTNRLCISLAAFILQQGTADLPIILRPLSTTENTYLLLEVLTVIPEEYNSMTMGSTLRARNRTALKTACPAVLEDMLQYLNTAYNDFSKVGPTEELIHSWLTAATCATSWLTLGGECGDLDDITTLPDRLPLCRALMTAVHVIYTHHEVVSDSALEACEACLSGLRAAGAAGGSSRHPRAALQLFTELAALAGPLMAKDNVPNSINEELLSALVTCAVALAECHAAVLVKGVKDPQNEDSAGARQILELLLAAQATPGFYPLHESRSNLVFGFWYTLQDEVLNSLENSQPVNDVWKYVFSRLLTTLVRKSEAPPEVDLTRDDLELLRCYRQDIADTVMYCFGILGDQCWSTVEEAFNAVNKEMCQEAALHIFLSLADAAPHQQCPKSLVNMLEHAITVVNTSQNKRMLNSALDCLGGYAPWLGSVQGSAGAGALGDACLRAAGAALSRSPASAALALRKLCTECTHIAATLVTDIVQVAQSEIGRSYAWVRRQLLGAAGAALGVAKLDVASPLLNDLADSLRNELDARIEADKLVGTAESVAALISALLEQPVLVAALVRAILPSLPTYAAHPMLVQPMFLILKQTIATLMEDCLPLMNEIAQLTLAGFDNRPCLAGLDVVKLMALVMGGSWPETPGVVHACVANTARAVAAGPADNADLTEALFQLLHTLTKKKPHYIGWIEDLLPQLVQLGTECVRMWEAGAARAACAWLATLATHRPAALQPLAPALTADALRCIGGVTPRNQIEPLAELLLALNRATWHSEHGDFATWLRQALSVNGFPTRHASDSHKHKFITAIIREKNSKRRLLETVQEFSLVCRGLIDTEYARQTLASKLLVT